MGFQWRFCTVRGEVLKFRDSFYVSIPSLSLIKNPLFSGMWFANNTFDSQNVPRLRLFISLTTSIRETAILLDFFVG